MPSIDAAMARSVRRGFGDVFIASLQPILKRQGIIPQINDAKTAFSSWDNCMQVNFCKWPVIAVIVVGGLIIFSVVWCMIRCLCCGMACCCSCFNCLKCCGNCCGCCDPPEKKHKYLDDSFIPQNQGYRPEAPMRASAAPPAMDGGGGYKRPAAAEPPQYAEFDVSRKKRSDDELPAMPSWESSANNKVEVEQSVEMSNLAKPDTPGATVPLMSRASPGPVSPVSPDHQTGPYAPPPRATPGMSAGPYGQVTSAQSSGYFNNSAPAMDPYGRGDQGYGNPNTGYAQGAYGQSQTSFGADQGYGNGADQGYVMAGAAMGPGPGRGQQAPRDYNGPKTTGFGQPNQGYRGPPSRQQSNDDYRRNGASPMQGGGGRRTPGGPGPAPGPYGMQRRPTLPDVSGGGDYGTPQPRRSPAPPQQGYNNGYNSSNPSLNQGGQYGASQRSYTGDAARYNYPARTPPQRQYSRDPAPAEMPAPVPIRASPDLQNNPGFDFDTNYSRGQDGYQPYSPTNAQAPAAYPGYKPYQPM